MKLKIVFIGAGNVAIHLSKVFLKKGHKILQVYSKTRESAESLAKQLNSSPVTEIQSIDNEADLYIFSVSDNAIPQIAGPMNLDDKNVVHTAGSVSLSALNKAKNYGVFYPLQTFSKSRVVNFSEIPICIEASNQEFNKLLTELAEQISHNVWQINSEQREQLHLSAVFACNFVNHMYAVAKKILEQKNIPFEILHPLIKETAIKATEMAPQLAQTGPALRNDTESLKKHIDLLSSNPEICKLYELISRDIYLKNKTL